MRAKLCRPAGRDDGARGRAGGHPTAGSSLRPAARRVSMPSNADSTRHPSSRPRPMSAPDPRLPPEPSLPPRQPRLLDRVRQAARVRHYSYRTEEAYVQWIRRFVLYHGKRHPQEMGAAQMNAFLTHLAVQGRVSASTQNQAFSALLFLYQKVLEVDPGRIEGVIRAVRPKRLPVVLSRDEAGRLLAELTGTYHLIGLVLY